eukprot:Hpha_TRINITY_DN16413_c2_g1::TRINITY_DN16413_c2_g1_i1::g.160475::m.160475
MQHPALSQLLLKSSHVAHRRRETAPTNEDRFVRHFREPHAPPALYRPCARGNCQEVTGVGDPVPTPQKPPHVRTTHHRTTRDDKCGGRAAANELKASCVYVPRLHRRRRPRHSHHSEGKGIGEGQGRGLGWGGAGALAAGGLGRGGWSLAGWGRGCSEGFRVCRSLDGRGRTGSAGRSGSRGWRGGRGRRGGHRTSMDYCGCCPRGGRDYCGCCPRGGTCSGSGGGGGRRGLGWSSRGRSRCWSCSGCGRCSRRCVGFRSSTTGPSCAGRRRRGRGGGRRRGGAWAGDCRRWVSSGMDNHNWIRFTDRRITGRRIGRGRVRCAFRNEIRRFFLVEQIWERDLVLHSNSLPPHHVKTIKKVQKL